MKVLVVNYYYAPAIDAQAYRWTQISQYWAARGFDVEVITGKIKGVPNNAIESGVRVHRVGFLRHSETIGLNSSTKPYLNMVKSRIINFLRPAYRKVYWPDALWHWFPFALVEVFRRRKVQYDLVISYYPCFSAHLAVRMLKTISRHPHFKWILDYGDPFCASETWQPNNYAIFNLLNCSIEKNCSNHGEMIFTNTETAAAYKAKLKTTSEFRVTPHLVDIGKFYSGLEYRRRTPGSAITMCYVGAFHPNIREPHRLFKLIKQLIALHGLNVILDIYGPSNGFDLSPADCPEINYHGYIEREKAILLLKTMDFVITVDNENCIMTPSKNVECIATGRPIINITNPSISYAPMNNYINAGYAIAVSGSDISDINVHEVYSFIMNNLESEVASISTVQDVLRAHTIEVIADAYLH